MRAVGPVGTGAAFGTRPAAVVTATGQARKRYRVISSEAFRKLEADTRKRFHRHREPEVYLAS